MNLDFRFEEPLEKRIVPLFEEIATSCRDEYNLIIASSTEPIQSNIDWWSETTSSRNTYSSPLFHYICCITPYKIISFN